MNGWIPNGQGTVPPFMYKAHFLRQEEAAWPACLPASCPPLTWCARA